jgi:hypothetical protein
MTFQEHANIKGCQVYSRLASSREAALILFKRGSCYTRSVPKISVLIFLRTTCERSTSLYRRAGNDLGCMYIRVQSGSVESVVSYCCLCTAVLYNLCNGLRCSRGIVHKELLPREHTLNHAFYKHVFERLPKRVQRVRQDM